MATTDQAQLTFEANGESYLPQIPPKTPRSANRYNKAVEEAPFSALAGVVISCKKPERHPESARHRTRKWVGISNRWRLPDPLGSDLLGTAQAVRAIRHTVTPSVKHIIAGESAALNLNTDIKQPYQFRAVNKYSACRGCQDSVQEMASSSEYMQHLLEPLKKSPLNSLRLTKPIEKPHEAFLYNSKLTKSMTAPDVLLQCLGMNFELHRPVIQRSETLADLLKAAEQPTAKAYYKNQVSETLDNFIMNSTFYSPHYKEMRSHLKKVELPATETSNATDDDGVKHPKHFSVEKINNMTVIKLQDIDEMVTQTALAITLGNLYREKMEVPARNVVSVLAAAHALKFQPLLKGCVDLMMTTICCETVCSYHKAAVKFKELNVEIACERWLELNLVPQMSNSTHLREMSMELLMKCLQANKLFTTSEFHLFKLVVHWTFFQLNPDSQIIPTYHAVLTYFNSLPKSKSLIETDAGQKFAPLYMTLRIHGISESSQLEDIQTTNIIPQSWIVKVLSQLYHSVQGGGDMSSSNNFFSDAIRHGFIVMEEPHFHSEIFSLHGFHFDLKGVAQSNSGTYVFYIQRLKPTDPMLSFKQCERNTFSMRAEREVRYSIRVQHVDDNQKVQQYCTGIISHRFGLGSKTCKSKIVVLENLKPPIYVSFSFVFPPS